MKRCFVESLAVRAPGLRACPWGSVLGETCDSEPQGSSLPARSRRRASQLTRLLVDAAAEAMDHNEGSLQDVPWIFGSALGEMATTVRLLESIWSEKTVSPAAFQLSVHNAAAGLLSIATGNVGFVTTVAAGGNTPAMALLEAAAWLAGNGGRILCVVADEAAVPTLATHPLYQRVAVAAVLAAEPKDHHLASLSGFQLATADAVTAEADDTTPLKGLDVRLPEHLQHNPCAGMLHFVRAVLTASWGRVDISVPFGESTAWTATVGEATKP